MTYDKKSTGHKQLQTDLKAIGLMGKWFCIWDDLATGTMGLI
jgi:hypothetical protein